MLTEVETAVCSAQKPGRGKQARSSSPKAKIKGFYYHIFYPLFFWAERVIGPAAIFLFMRPIALLDLARRWHQFPQFRRLRGVAPKSFWQGVSARSHYRKMIFDWHESMGTSLMYGRLALPRWRKRITVRNGAPFDTPGWQKRPIIIALMHTGSYGIIRTWLRSRGVQASLFAAGLPPILDHPIFHKHEEEADRAYGLEGVPGYFRSHNSLRDLLRFLRPGRVLLMALDGGTPSPDSDRQETGDFPIFVKKGICRIGAQVDALVYPASMKRIGFCRYEIRFGPPVPEQLMQDNPTEATHQLVTELWRDIRVNPDDLIWSMMESFPPTAEERQRAVDERPRTWP